MALPISPASGGFVNRCVITVRRSSNSTSNRSAPACALASVLRCSKKLLLALVLHRKARRNPNKT